MSVIINGTTGVTFNDATTQGSAFIGGQAQVFTASGTFTPPTGVTAVKATVIAGGGGGGTGVSGRGGGGGGGGGIAVEWITGLSGAVTVTIGAGGASATAGNTSSFGAFCSATGGAAGTNGTGVAPGVGGAGGVGSGGNLNMTGSSGGAAAFGGGTLSSSGAGGGYTKAIDSLASLIAPCVYLEIPGYAATGYLGGFGGASRTTNGVGNAATGFGCGGGGGFTSTGTAVAGGAGTAGIVIVEY